MTSSIHLSCASSLILRSVLKETSAVERITEWRDYTTRISTRLSSVTAILIRFSNASTVTIAPSLIQWKI